MEEHLDVAPETALPVLLGRGLDPIRDLISRLAPTDIPVLVLGETGVGKQVVAQEIVKRSLRSESPFVPVNCGALSDALLEADLFGHARGAFTGAEKERAGFFEFAQGGTIFLDEIADLSPRGQAAILRVIEEGRVRRLGEARERVVDVRVIAATNKDLRDCVRKGLFREDLYYRLAGSVIVVPPLRERAVDISVLARQFVAEVNAADDRPKIRLGAAALRGLRRHSWPGNVRELKNFVEALPVLCGGGEISPRRLDRALREQAGTALRRPQKASDSVRASLRRAKGNVSKAADLHGVSRMHFYRLMRKAGLRTSEKRRSESTARHQLALPL